MKTTTEQAARTEQVRVRKAALEEARASLRAAQNLPNAATPEDTKALVLADGKLEAAHRLLCLLVEPGFSVAVEDNDTENDTDTDTDEEPTPVGDLVIPEA